MHDLPVGAEAEGLMKRWIDAIAREDAWAKIVRNVALVLWLALLLLALGR